MGERSAIGVFLCRCQGEREKQPQIQALDLDGVVLTRELENLCSFQESLQRPLEAGDLTGAVILCSDPNGIEGDLRQLVKGHQTLKIVRGGEGEEKRLREAVLQLTRHQSPKKQEIKVQGQALVIGGGIAGIQAALDIAQAGFPVYLVEKSPSLGGHMAQLDKTFPTLDCSACILTPKMVDAAGHPNIQLFTYSQVEAVSGHVGAFQVKIRQKARYVKEDRCTGCGNCAQVCRVKGSIPSEYEEGMGKRGAIYLPFPQAVPSTYTIDSNHCLFLTRGKCGKEPPCIASCDREAIDLQDQDTFVHLEVGTIVVATGFHPFDASKKVAYAYNDSPQVITGLELERLLSASGPTGGRPIIQTDRGAITPQQVAFIQCVGSRDLQVEREYCSRVCCMYTAKQALLLMEKLPEVSVSIYYMDVRAFGKGFEEFYDQVRRKGVRYIRGSPAEVYPSGEQLVLRAEDTLTGESLEELVDLVVLAVGLEPQEDAGSVGEILGLACPSHHFFQEYHPQRAPMNTENGGIYLAGTCQAPRDIPDTINHAKGAAAAAMLPLFYQKILVYFDGEKTFWEPVKNTHIGGLVNGR